MDKTNNIEEIKNEIIRLQDRCLTSDGKAYIVADWIWRLMLSKDIHNLVGDVPEYWNVVLVCDDCKSGYDTDHAMCISCGKPNPRKEEEYG